MAYQDLTSSLGTPRCSAIQSASVASSLFLPTPSAGTDYQLATYRIGLRLASRPCPEPLLIGSHRPLVTSFRVCEHGTCQAAAGVRVI